MNQPWIYMYFPSQSPLPYIIKGETDHQPRLDAWDKCLGLVHWELILFLCFMRVFKFFFPPLEYSYFTMLVSHSTCFAYYWITSNTGLFIDQHRSGFLSYICCCFVLFVWKWQIVLESPCIMGIPIGQCGCCSKGHIEKQNHWVPISEGFTF